MYKSELPMSTKITSLVGIFHSQAIFHCSEYLNTPRQFEGRKFLPESSNNCVNNLHWSNTIQTSMFLGGVHLSCVIFYVELLS